MDDGFDQAGRPPGEDPGSGPARLAGVSGFLVVVASSPERPGPGSRVSPGGTTSTVPAGAAGLRFVITEFRCGPDSTEFP
jgi:hypothetical protein